MQLMKLLHKTFEKELPSVHKIRLKNLMSASEALVNVNKLTLTALGRALPKTIQPRSNVKKMDRLLANPMLQRETVLFYKAMNANLIAENSCPWIYIDWSCICSITNLYLLRATLSMPGRSIVIYEECHTKENENNHDTHKEFLNNLKVILPSSVKPVIVTDAGFRALWFSYVRSLGWYFVGRIRNKNLVRLDSNSDWQLSHSLYENATGKPTCLGRGILTKSEQVPVSFILYKKKKKNRHKLTISRTKSQGGMSKRYSKAHQEPWLLVTSLPLSSNIAKKTVQIYRQRMRIEENFRDTKCTRYGFGLKESRSRSPERMKILLLIAAIATFACWLAGIYIRQRGDAAEYQVQSAKFISCLSKVFLGREALKDDFEITIKEFVSTLSLLFEINIAAQNEAAVHA